VSSSYAEASDGTVLIFNGINSPLRWDGLTAQAEPVGVIAPATAPVMSGSGLGGIIGTYYAYVRFYDRFGYFSNLSPISAAFTPAVTIRTITNLLDTTPIIITTLAHGLTTGATVTVTGVTGDTAANVTTTVTVINADAFSLDGTATSGTWAGGGVWTAGCLTITYTGVPVPTEPKVVGRQILRNTTGQAQTFYVDVDTADLTSTTFSSTLIDNLLTTQLAVPLFDSRGAPLANANGLPPNWKSAVGACLNRMFCAVDVHYTVGSAAVVFGSATVQGIGTEWTVEMAGRFFSAAAAAATYQIASVNVANQTLTLDSPYLGFSDPYTSYSISPDPAEERTVYYSEAELPDSWPAINGLSIQQDGDQLTGLMSKGSFMYFLERRHIYRFTFQSDPGQDGFVFLTANRGCINNRCWVLVEDYAYMLDDGGIHAFYGGQLSKPVSEPIQDIFETQGKGPYRINWAASEFFHAVHYPGQHTIRWFVALSGDYLPRHALTFDYRSSRWWIEEYAFNIGGSALGAIGRQPNVLLGGPAGRVFAMGVGALDGPDPLLGTVRGTVTTGLADGFTDGASSFPGTGVVGSPVVLVAGRGKGQRRIVASVTGQTIRTTQPWTVLPDSTTVYQLGGIVWLFLSSVWRFVLDEEENPRRVEVVFQATTNPGSFDALLYLDRSNSPILWDETETSEQGNGFASTKGSAALTADLTKPSGFVQKRIDGRREFYVDGPRFVELELQGVSGQDQVTVYQIVIDGVVP
jgi:hypothetical protein